MYHDPIALWLGSWSSELTLGSAVIRVVLAILVASVIGWERASKRHSAGLRTFILISFSSAVAMLLDIYLGQTVHQPFPILSAASIISIAMLSGNSVLFSSRNQIKGLTTSAGLWACGILGLTAGAGLYSITLIVFLLLMCIITYLTLLEVYLKNRSNHFEIHLELTDKNRLQDFVTTIRRLGLRVDDIESNSAYLGSGLSVYSITITIISAELKKYKTHSEIIQALGSLEYVYHIEEMN